MSSKAPAPEPGPARRRRPRPQPGAHRPALYFGLALVLIAILVGAFELWLTSRG